jgi:hypothetical protein
VQSKSTRSDDNVRRRPPETSERSPSKRKGGG